jgi:hypothetical protein
MCTQETTFFKLSGRFDSEKCNADKCGVASKCDGDVIILINISISKTFIFKFETMTTQNFFTKLEFVSLKFNPKRAQKYSIYLRVIVETLVSIQKKNSTRKVKSSSSFATATNNFKNCQQS